MFQFCNLRLHRASSAKGGDFLLQQPDIICGEVGMLSAPFRQIVIRYLGIYEPDAQMSRKRATRTLVSFFWCCSNDTPLAIVSMLGSRATRFPHPRCVASATGHVVIAGVEA